MDSINPGPPNGFVLRGESLRCPGHRKSTPGAVAMASDPDPRRWLKQVESLELIDFHKSRIYFYLDSPHIWAKYNISLT